MKLMETFAASRSPFPAGLALTLLVALLGLPQGNAHAQQADIVFLFDTSASMSNDINQVRARILEFDTALTNAGIDAHYALVRFTGTEALVQDTVPFTTFVAPGSPFQTLTTGGVTERGSQAVNIGLTATFRPGSVRNFILITDEDDDSTPAQFNAANLGLTGADALFNFIGVPGRNNTDARYGVLAANHGGVAFNILNFRANPGPFFTNFTNTKVREIAEEIEERQAVVPEPGTAALLGIGLTPLAVTLRRRYRKRQ